MKIEINYKRFEYQMNKRVLLENDSFTYNYDSKTKLLEILDNKDSNGYVFFSECYELSTIMIDLRDLLPFVVNEKNEILWNQSYEDIYLADFIRTFEFEDIHVNVFSTPTGGFDVLKSTIEIWEEVYPIIDLIIENWGKLFISLEAFRRIGNVFVMKEVSPLHVFDVIFLKPSWTSDELSMKLDIDKEDSKRLLQVCGYKWSKSERKYVNLDPNKDKKRLTDINYYSENYKV